MLLIPGAAAGQTCDSFVEGFDLFQNEGGWVWSGTFQASVSAGGVPTWHVYSEPLHMALPSFRSTQPAPPFTGDYRSAEVTSLGLDLQSFTIDAAACLRPLSLVLSSDQGTSDPSDDLIVTQVSSQALPCADGTWHSFTLEVPSRESTLPLGWRVEQSSLPDDDATWNALITDVTHVRWSLGDPLETAGPTDWRMGADNARVAYGGGPTSYCVSKTTSAGCSPGLTWIGRPSVSSGAFVIHANQMITGQAGLFFYGFAASGAPFMGGTLCVAGPHTRTPVMPAQGADKCSGRVFWNAGDDIQSGSNAALAVGATVYAQAWGRDPQGTAGSSLSNAIRFTICP
ncbi:MAG: hypothetical protein O2816_00075 [Planctomycetota bacterium]|nr:hypothetical protein [Planctomycetota bacterium]